MQEVHRIVPQASSVGCFSHVWQADVLHPHTHTHTHTHTYTHRHCEARLLTLLVSACAAKHSCLRKSTSALRTACPTPQSYCPFCKRAKKALLSIGIKPLVLELDEREDGAVIQQELLARTGQRTVPSVSDRIVLLHLLAQPRFPFLEAH